MRKLPIISAKNTFHQIVKTALEKEGWIITHDPYSIDLGFVDLYIDLGAERLIAATKNGEKTEYCYVPKNAENLFQFIEFLRWGYPM